MRRPFIAAAVGLVLVAAACVDEPAREYSDATERAFMRACVAGLGDELDEVCACSYERLTRRLSFDEYEKLNTQLTNDSDDIPDELTDIVAACAARNS